MKASRIRVAVFGVFVSFLAGGGSAWADFTFGEPVNLGPPVNTGGDEGAPCVSADGLSLYFSSFNREGGYGGIDIWGSTRATTEDQWGEPVNLGPPVNRQDENSDEWLPAISTDGLELYFASWQYDPTSGYYSSGGICVTKRSTTADPWGQPTMLDLAVDGAGFAGGPSLSADGLELYFCNLAEQESEARIYVTKRETIDAPWGVPISLGPVVNNWSCQVWPRISSDGLVLLFCDYWRCSFRPGGAGAADIWLTMRTTTEGDWSEPVNAGPPLNAPSGDYCGIISGDGSTIYFESSRGGGQGGSDLWQAPVLPVVDLDQDAKVGMSDLLTMIEYWGTDERRCDIGPMPWGNGVVDATDLEVLMKYWGQDMYPPIGLIAHWKLDETDGLTADDSVDDNDGALMGGPAWQPEAGIIDGALMLDGLDDYIVADRILNPAHGSFSVFAWIKGGAPGQVVVSQQSGANWLRADASEGRLMTELGATGDGSALYSETGIIDDDWHRVGFTWDASIRRLYVDDVLVAEDAQTGLASSYGRHYIGRGKDPAPETFFTGLIDDVRIYDRAVKP